ncbi:polysaccharide biosynthesis/export family protein [Chitinophagaceae bacterium LWZ2-11]
MRKIHCLLVVAIISLSACGPTSRINKNYNYFQKGLDSLNKLVITDPTIKPNDQLSIQVFSSTINQEQAALFNIPMIPVGGTATANPALLGYLVDQDGNVNMPMLSKVHVADSTTDQIQKDLIKKLSVYVKDVDVIVKYYGIKVNVLGEVKSPGQKTFTNPRVTILDAIAMSGDLDDFAKREEVLVLREDSGMVKHYTVDMRDAKSVLNSPVFQLKQNDLIYVSANNIKLKSINRDPNFDRNIQIVAGISSVVALIVSLASLLKR